jgi:nucleotide-binding universal stress UspA family protein
MKRFKKILCLNESTQTSTSAIERAVALAESNRAGLTILDVIPTQALMAGIGFPTGETIASGLQEAIVADHRSTLETKLQTYTQRFDIEIDVQIGKTYLETIRAVLRNEYDLVIKSVENPSWTQRLFGSDDLHLLRKCPCPVWLVKPTEEPASGNILAAVDFDPINPSLSESDLNHQILDLAASLALSESGTLHIVHAWEALAEVKLLSRANFSLEEVGSYVRKEEEHHSRGLSALVEEMSGRIGRETWETLSPRLHLPKGPATQVIAPLAAELRADLVVMGTIARTGISGLLIGNTAEAILDQIACSVLAVKPHDFRTPIQIEA